MGILFRDLQYDPLKLALAVLFPENAQLEEDITRRDAISRNETSEQCMEMAVELVRPQQRHMRTEKLWAFQASGGVRVRSRW